MKFVCIALLISSFLGNSTRAIAEGPIPFKAMMQAAGAQPSIPPAPDAKSSATAALTQTPPPSHMTTGGKVMTGVGIGFVALGTLVFISGAALVNDSWFGDAAGPVMGVGAVLGGGGTALIVFGNHRRTTK